MFFPFRVKKSALTFVRFIFRIFSTWQNEIKHYFSYYERNDIVRPSKSHFYKIKRSKKKVKKKKDTEVKKKKDTEVKKKNKKEEELEYATND